MFLLYINEIGKNIIHSHIRLFADDWLLYREISCDKEIQIQDEIKLQRDLISLQDWSQTWQMQFNVQKCYILSVTKKGQQLDKKYSLNGHILKSVDHNPYLGVKFQCDLKWSHHITNMTNKASRSLGIVYSTFGQCPAEVRASGYYTLVRPQLEYTSAAWDSHYIKDVKKLEGIQRKAARFMIGNRERTEGTVTSILADFELPPPPLRSPTQSPENILHKALTGEVALPVPHQFIVQQRPTRNHQGKRMIPISTSTDIYKYSIWPRSITDWNV